MNAVSGVVQSCGADHICAMVSNSSMGWPAAFAIVGIAFAFVAFILVLSKY